jgi:hypothetical protein
VGHGDLVAVDVDDAGIRGDLLGDLVHVALGRDAGADIEELADPRLPGEVADGPPQEGPVLAHGGTQDRVHGQHRAGGVLVGEEVVAAAQPVVIDTGRVGLSGVNSRRYPARLHLITILSFQVPLIFAHR